MMIINSPHLTETCGWFKDHGKEEDVVISSRVRLSRNLTGFLFPDKMEMNDEDRSKNIIMNAFERIGEKDHIFSISDISNIERRMLAERSIISQNFTLNIHKYFFLREDQLTSGVINDHDHLRLAAFKSGLGLEDVYTQIDSLESELEKYLDFAVSLEFGYLNENIKNSGTGMKLSVMFHLPALIHLSLFDRAIKSSLDKEFTVKGYLGNNEGSLGDLYQISNGLAIGTDEKELIDKLNEISNKLIKYERQAREELLQKRKIELEDKIYRSIGLIENCRLLNAAEAIKVLTDIRLGVVLGILKFDLILVNSLLLITQKAHIQFLIGSNKSDTLLIDSKRAELIRNTLGVAE
jgi:protein arginine kinase